MRSAAKARTHSRAQRAPKDGAVRGEVAWEDAFSP